MPNPPDLRQWTRDSASGPVDYQHDAQGVTLGLFALIALFATLTIGLVLAICVAVCR